MTGDYFAAEDLAQQTFLFVYKNMDDFGDGSKTRIASPTLRKWGAAILFVIGASMLWNNFKGVVANLIPEEYWNMVWPIFDKIPQFVISILIIAVGIGLIAAKKKEVSDGE